MPDSIKSTLILRRSGAPWEMSASHSHLSLNNGKSLSFSLGPWRVPDRFIKTQGSCFSDRDGFGHSLNKFCSKLQNAKVKVIKMCTCSVCEIDGMKQWSMNSLTCESWFTGGLAARRDAINRDRPPVTPPAQKQQQSASSNKSFIKNKTHTHTSCLSGKVTEICVTWSLWSPPQGQREQRISFLMFVS